MEIKVPPLTLELEEVVFIVNPETKRKGEEALIFTHLSKEDNVDRIFALPGEYNLKNVYFYADLNNEKKLNYFFITSEGKIILTESFVELPQVKKFFSSANIDALILLKKPNKIDFLKELKPKNIFTVFDFNLPGYEKIKDKKIKINLQRSENKIFILEQ